MDNLRLCIGGCGEAVAKDDPYCDGLCDALKRLELD